MFGFSFVSEQDYEQAINFYTKAIEVNPNNAIYFGNRSMAYLRTECFGAALRDATKAIAADRDYVKGYYRRAEAYMSLGKFKLALSDYQAVSIHNIIEMNIHVPSHLSLLLFSFLSYFRLHLCVQMMLKLKEKQ